MIVCWGLVCAACTTNPVPEEEFEGPEGNFPLLADVPDRPTLPKLDRQKLTQELEQHNKESNEIKEIISPKVAESPPIS